MPTKRRAVLPAEGQDTSAKRSKTQDTDNVTEPDEAAPETTSGRVKGAKKPIGSVDQESEVPKTRRKRAEAAKQTAVVPKAILRDSTGAKLSRTKVEGPGNAVAENGLNKEIKNAEAVISSTRGPKAQRRTKAKTTITEDPSTSHSEDEKITVHPRRTPTKAKTKTTATKDDSVGTAATEEPESKPKKTPVKRKTKEEKEAEAMPLNVRTPQLRMFVGAHVSGAGGVHNGVTNAVHIGGNAFALFLKSQRKWENPPLKDEHREQFKKLCDHHVYAADKHVLPHGSYLVNLAQLEREKADQAYNAFLDDIKRCEALGIKLYNFHPGNTGSQPRPEAISRIANQLNKAIKATSTVIPVLETMAGGNNVIGSTFEDLRDIIGGIEDKSRIGVCIDTCHIFAAGYDIRTPETFKETIDKFDSIVGLQYLKGFHMNDSKAPFGSHRDLHQNIGLGFLGLRAFHNVMNEARFEDIPMVLETPTEQKDDKGKTFENKSIWANEIKLLESLIDLDVHGEEFLTMEKDLAAKGAAERAKLQEQVNKKTEKDAKKAAGGGRRKKKKANEDDEMSEDSD